MIDGKVSITATLAWVGWAASGLFLIAAWVSSSDVHTTTEGMVLCSLAIIAAAAAATLHTRSFFCSFARDLRNAYQYGVDVGRAEAMGRPFPFQKVH